MNSNEILQQHLTDSLPRQIAYEKLSGLITQQFGRLNERQEAAKARYVIGFLERYRQYRSSEVTVIELLMNLRDLIRYIGRLRVSQEIYDLVQKFGRDFGLIIEGEYEVTVNTVFPNWLVGKQFVEEVYSMKPQDTWEPEVTSIGDDTLSGKTVFTSYKSFEQKLAVHTAIKLPFGNTLLVSQPTGGGKSLITQMLASVTGGLTLVIVPTVALALDQFKAAKNNMRDNKGIFCYRGDQSSQNRAEIMKAIRERSAKLIFTSPEAVLKNSEFYGLLEECAIVKYLCNVVIDEAHIVPDWGIFFRPDFQIFSIILKRWRKKSQHHIRTYLLSATLSNDVVDTIFTLFGEKGRNTEVRCDALRQEPRFCFQETKSKFEQNEKTIELIKLLPKPMVVYVLEPSEATVLQSQLRNIGMKNIPTFTGKTKDLDRDTILEGWKRSKYDVIIATSAFGIGVDKPDVRTIIHACVPENLSRFYQEVGRAGRDGLPSLSVLLPYTSFHDGEGDLKRAFGLVSKRVLRVESIIVRWFSMLRNQTSNIFGDIAILNTSATPSTMTDDEVEYAGNRNIAWNINLLLFLHRNGFIDVIDAIFKHENSSYFMTVKILNTSIMNDPKLMASNLEKVRQDELDSQLNGYYIMRKVVQHPNSVCWSVLFKKLFPHSKESCNGCPLHPHGNYLADSLFKMRTKPVFGLPAAAISNSIKRYMGSYSKLIIRQIGHQQFDKNDVQLAAKKVNNGEVKALVLPKDLIGYIEFQGIVLTYMEFSFAVNYTPYLFSNGVLCIFGFDQELNNILMKNLFALETFDYRHILYCNENMLLQSTGKPICESFDCYVVNASEL